MKGAATEWDEYLRGVRLGSSMLYGILLSYLGIRYSKNGEISMSYSVKKGNYYLSLPRVKGLSVLYKIDSSVKMNFILIHELEHLLRMHIPRGYSLAKHSEMITKIGMKNTGMVLNVIADFLINSSLVDYIKDSKDRSFIDVPSNMILHDNDVSNYLTWVPVDVLEVFLSDKDNLTLEKIFSFVDSFDIPDAKKENLIDIDINMDLDIDSYEGAVDGESGSLDSTSASILVDSENLTSISAGSNPGDLVKSGDFNRVSYDIRSFLDSVMSFIVSDEIIFTKRRPPRKPNTAYGITRITLAPRCAVLFDSSGSVPMSNYKEFYNIATDVFDVRGADVESIIFDGGVAKVIPGVPSSVEKTDGGTLFGPALQRALDDGYDNIIMLTDGMNFDSISASIMARANILFLLTSEDGASRISCDVDIPKSSLFVIDMSKNEVRPIIREV